MQYGRDDVDDEHDDLYEWRLQISLVRDQHVSRGYLSVDDDGLGGQRAVREQGHSTQRKGEPVHFHLHKCGDATASVPSRLLRRRRLPVLHRTVERGAVKLLPDLHGYVFGLSVQVLLNLLDHTYNPLLTILSQHKTTIWR